jgi:hypothetical protein
MFSLLFFRKKNILLLKNAKLFKSASNKLNHRNFKKRWRKKKFYKKFLKKKKNRFFRQINKNFYLPSFKLYKNSLKNQFDLNVGNFTFLFNKKLKCFYLSNFKKIDLTLSINNQTFKNINFLKY